jgi:hypothetical protein
LGEKGVHVPIPGVGIYLKIDSPFGVVSSGISDHIGQVIGEYFRLTKINCLIAHKGNFDSVFASGNGQVVGVAGDHVINHYSMKRMWEPHEDYE